MGFSVLQPNLAIEDLPSIGPRRGQTLRANGIATANDLVTELPRHYREWQNITPIAKLQPGSTVTIEVTIRSCRSIRFKGRGAQRVSVIVEDGTDSMNITFFNQSYLEKILVPGARFAFAGKVSTWMDQPTMVNPHHEKISSATRLHTGRIVAIYSEMSGAGSAWRRRLLNHLLIEKPFTFNDGLPDSVVNQWGSIGSALQNAHFPGSIKEALTARRRLAMTELWQLKTQLVAQKELFKNQPRWQPTSKEIINWTTKFIKQLPFTLSQSQQKTITTLSEALKSGQTISHLVQGEVGSGKTVIAAWMLGLAAQAKQQALMLVPTRILAKQHYASLEPWFSALNIPLNLWISEQAQKPELPKGVIVGTTAIRAKQNWEPAVVVVDEEHRFGVEQRNASWGEPAPHLMQLTATPIPRSLATFLLDQRSSSFLELPDGRSKKIQTRLLSEEKVIDHLRWLQNKVLPSGAAAFLIAPFIEPATELGWDDVYSLQKLTDLIKKNLPNLAFHVLSGKTKAKEQSSIWKDIESGKVQLLLATPVIEVGIDIAHAEVVTIFSADRFGLAALHQLRGRVGRRGQDSWCFLHSTKTTAAPRLRLVASANDGNELAEADLSQRGGGELLGLQQSGWGDLQVASWGDSDLIKTVAQAWDSHHTKA